MANGEKSVSVIHNRVFQVIMMSGIMLQIGIWVRNFAILLYVTDKTDGNAFAVSLIYLAEFLPIFVFSFIGGTFADRWRPKLTIVSCDFLSACSVFAVLLALVYGSWKAVFFATLISAILSQFSQPSVMKLFKLHLPDEQTQTAMSLFQTMFAGFMVLGPILGTFVYQQFGIHVAIGTMGVAFLLSAAIMTMLPHEDKSAKQVAGTSFLREMSSGIRYVFSSKILSLLGVGFVIAGLALGLIQPLPIFLVTERLKLPETDLQWLIGASGFAMILGGVASMSAAKRVAPHILLMVGMTVNAVSIAVSGWSSALWLTLVAQFCSGFVFPGIQVGINTLMLKNSAAEYIGRVNGILNPLFMGSLVVTMSISGLLKNQFSLVSMYEISGALFLLGVVLLLPMHRLIRQSEKTQATAMVNSEMPSN
ncbi:MAG TPA: MFS transporter [Bacilli bacterium]